MAATGFTPIKIYASSTASSVPLAANLDNTNGAELAINTADGRLFYKDSSGVVQTMASKGTGSIGGSTTQVQFNNAGALGGSASLTWNGTVLTSSGFAGPLNGTVGATTPAAGSFTTTTIGTSETLSYGTANGVAYLNGSKVVTSGSALTYDGTTFAAPLTSLSGNGIVLTVDRTGTGGNDRTNVQFSNAGTVRGGIGTVGASDGIYFNQGTTEGMRLTSTGLGIGTSSPAAKLDVQTSGVGIQLKQNSAGSATYYVMDNTIESGGKRWRFGYSGAAGIPCFSLYNQTDNVLSLVADASGNLGLGVTPSAWRTNSGERAIQIGGNYPATLHADGGGYFDIGSNYYLNSSGNFIYTASGSATRYYMAGGGATSAHVWQVSSSGTAGNAITFTQAMTLDASGNLGIGTSSPANKLQVAGAVVATGAAASYAAGMTIIDYASGNSNITAIGPNTSTVGTTVFQSFSSNASLGGERMRIDSSGNLLVGQTALTGSERLGVTFTGSNNGGYFYNVSASPTGSAVFANFGNATGTNNTSCNLFRGRSAGDDRIFIYGNGNVQNTNNSYGAISDVKLKENIVNATPKLANLMQVQVRNYNLIGETTKQIGVVAQELETVFPSMIDESPDRDEEGNDLGTTTKSVKYSVFVPMLIKAMQEQQDLIQDLTTRLAALEAK